MSAVETALIAVGLAGLVGFLAWTLAARRAAETRAEDIARIAQLEATMAAAVGQDQALEDRMTALSSRMAEQQRKDFLDIAEERFKRLQSEAEKEAKAQITEMEGLVKPIEQSLASLGEATQALEEKRIGAIAGVQQQMQEVGALATRLGTEASNLSTALRRSSAVRGDWGEVALRNILELAGMNAHADFKEQASTDTGRPDVIVNLPGDGVIPIDAKATAKHYLEALETEEGPQREALFDRHAKALRGRVTELTRKEYWSSFGDRAQFVVMFVPSEALISSAFDRDPDLHEWAMNRQVIIASPASLIGLLRTVALTWQQVQFAEQAQDIVDTARLFYTRMATWSAHFAKVGTELNQASEAYNAAVNSWETRVLPQARRLEEMQVADNTSAQLKDLPNVDLALKEPTVPDDE
ncbi:MAG TPA: DNA recombination protein RmuC [Candidatus Poseidoniaceae archaeon]|nr:MAG TPA: DNA recombination protein RmuC [Candidatus Poseidoniales archaeon]HIH53812.1 DNA recombination protein RmuC [Candidatus Poseidoniaceae archaeon]